MSKPRMSRTQEELAIHHLRKHGYITPAIALLEYGNPRLAATINRLRTTHKALVPDTHEIITDVRYSESGVRYTKYQYINRERALARGDIRPSARGLLLEVAA